MEYHRESLESALRKLAEYEPKEDLWVKLDQNLGELPLQAALTKLPDYEPSEKLWDLIETETVHKKKFYGKWWFAAAAVMVVSLSGLWLLQRSKTDRILYSVEKVDNRLQAENGSETEQQYEKVKAFCEAETLICSNKDFKRLQKEYETLDVAADQLKEAMGDFNTEPELMRQYSIVEQEKAEILNKMAKMI